MAKIVGIISFMNAAGAQEALLRLSRHMRARGHDMEVWFLYEEDDIHAAEPHIRVFEHKTRLNPLEYLKVFSRLRQQLRAEKPDAVVGFLPLGNVFGMSAAFLAGVPWRVASQRAPGPTFGKVMRIFDRALGNSRVYDKIICVSDAVRTSFDRYPVAYRNKLSVVHNGIEWRASTLSVAQARAVLGLPVESFVFGAIGRMKVQKNYFFMLDAFAATKDGILVIAGDGKLRPELEAHARTLGIADRVVFLGALGREEVRHFLRAMDVFVQTSLYEGQSNAVLEAMNEGLPMLLSDIPEQRETIVDDVSGKICGMLAPLGNLPEWQLAFRTLRADADLRRDLGEAGLAFVNARFTLDAMIDGFERILVRQKSKQA
jgi:glycosyltransferase involved in cell wall biosynthesis